MFADYWCGRKVRTRAFAYAVQWIVANGDPLVRNEHRTNLTNHEQIRLYS